MSPADGKIAAIAEVMPPRELALGGDKRTRVSVFLSILDVHIVRTPVGGRIGRSVYVPGDSSMPSSTRQAMRTSVKLLSSRRRRARNLA